MHVFIQSSRSTALSTAKQTATSAKTTGRGELEAGGRSLRPHPPVEPIDSSILQIQRKRVELSSSEKQTNSLDHTSDKFQSRGLSTSSGVAEMSDGRGADRGAPHEDDEESVMELLKEVEIEREELERKRHGSNDIQNETTYHYSSHPKLAANLIVR